MDDALVAKLLSCPFCGGAAEMDTRRWYRQYPSGKPGEAVAVYCQDCSVDISLCREDVPELSADDVAANVVERWNRRAPDRTVDDCAALIRQLVRLLREASPTGDLCERAMDYLKRKGLQGSPLRDNQPKESTNG